MIGKKREKGEGKKGKNHYVGKGSSEGEGREKLKGISSIES